MSRTPHKMIGNIFGYLFVHAESRESTARSKKFIVSCNKCGRYFTMSGGNIRRSTSTCAMGCKKCYLPEKIGQFAFKHGLSGLPEYKVWEGMIRRCYSSKHENYNRYGGRGIFVCGDWKKNPDKFINWLRKNKWERGLTIDRKNNDKGYSPSNCRIVTYTVNANNKSNNRHISVNGIVFTISEASRKFDVKVTTIRERLNRGWSDERSVSEVIR